MNSFSVTSNIRTALKITGDITAGLQEFYNAPEEVSHVENEMTELTLAFDVIQRTTEAQKLDTNDDKTIERISSLVNNVENKLRNISTILHKVQSVGANGEQKISKKAWAREKSNVLKMVQELRKTRKTLFFITCSSMALVQMSSLPQRQWCVDIETSVTNLQASVKECYDVAREVTLSQRIESDPMTRCDTRNRRQGRSPSPIPILSIHTSKTITHCEYPCPCRCHIRSSFETPAWLKNVVGALFLNYTGSPVWGRQPCDHHLCMKSGKISSSYTYHFPYWMMAKAVVFSVSAHGVGGLGTAWTINIPNQLPGTNPVWRFLNSGTVQQLDSVLRSGVALPSDMNEDGKSLLHFAVENERPDMCDFLIQAGVNKSFQDNSGMTASMMALTKVIPATASESRTWKIHRIYEIFQDQDLFEDLGFS